MSADGPMSPPPGENPQAAFAARVAQVAAERAAAWDAFADVLTAPGPGTAARLRTGELTQTWRAGVRWLGTDTEMFTGPLMNLDVYARGAHRRTLVEDLAVLQGDHGSLVAQDVAVLGYVRDVAQLCRQESDAWLGGDVASGKELRGRQHALVEEHLAPVMQALGWRLVTSAQANIWRTLGRLLLAYLSVESGRDYLALAPNV